MKHYICHGGCGGVSETPGTCQTVACPQHQEPLEACDCLDGRHYGVLGASEDWGAEEERDE
ncbi:MAG: hypothetical protein Q7S84_00535 [bacterium]|nr:hypothetical protein [bacterium]